MRLREVALGASLLFGACSGEGKTDPQVSCLETAMSNGSTSSEAMYRCLPESDSLVDFIITTHRAELEAAVEAAEAAKDREIQNCQSTLKSSQDSAHRLGNNWEDLYRACRSCGDAYYEAERAKEEKTEDIQ